MGLAMEAGWFTRDIALLLYIRTWRALKTRLQT